MGRLNFSLLIVIAFFIIYVVWGSTYMFNKIAISEISPLYVCAVRFTSAGLLMLILSKIFRYKLKITTKQLLNCFIIGFLFLTYGNGIFVWSLQFVDSGFAALEASTQPLFVLLLMRFTDRKPMKFKSIAGVVFGTIGMYLLVSQESIVVHKDSILAILIILTCVFSWSYGSVLVSRIDMPKNNFVSATYQMIFGGILLFLFSFSFQEPLSLPSDWSFKVQSSVLFLILFGSIAAFTSYNFLLKNVSTEKVVTSTYVNPVIALFLGWYVLDERLTTQSIIAALFLIMGVYFINSKKER